MTTLHLHTSDSVTDASKRLGCPICKLFKFAASNCRHGHGFSNNGEVGEKWYNMWKQKGYTALPPAVKVFILECNEGQHKELIESTLVH